MMDLIIGDHVRLYLYLNDTLKVQGAGRMVNASAYSSVNLVNCLIEVKKGDLIHLTVNNDTDSRGILTNDSTASYITVEAFQ